MVRSLYAGISGLRSHQVALDVTGNNIANVNTVGFKAGRATFKEAMAQTLQGPSRPAGNQSGTNPLQIGLGTSIGSIDTMLRQGNMQTTGQITDLAIEGRAYFAFSSGAGTFYSRNGGLHLDAEGYLVSPTTGWRLQGKMADTFGNYGAGSTIGDLRIPWGEKAPAKATTQVQFGCNLNADSQEQGTITHTNSFLRSAALGTGRALSVELGTAAVQIDRDYVFNTISSDTFVAATEVARLENEIARSYRDIDRYRSDIAQKEAQIAEINGLLDDIDAPVTGRLAVANAAVLNAQAAFEDHPLLGDGGVGPYTGMINFLPDGRVDYSDKPVGDPPAEAIFDTLAALLEAAVRAEENINAEKASLETKRDGNPPYDPVTPGAEGAIDRTALGYVNGLMRTINDLLNGTVAATPPAIANSAAGFNGINTLLAPATAISTTPPPLFTPPVSAPYYSYEDGSIVAMTDDLAVLREIVAEQKASEIDAIAGRTPLTALFDDGGNNLGIKGGDVITMNTGDDSFPAFKFTVLREGEILPEGDPSYPHANYPLVGRTLDDFRKAMEAYLNALNDVDFSGNLTNKQKSDMMNASVTNYVRGIDSGASNARGPITIDYDTDGSFRITNDTGRGNPAREFTIPHFGVSSSRPTSSGYVGSVFSFNSPIHSINATESVDMPSTMNGDGSVNYIPNPNYPDIAKRSLGTTKGGAIFIPAATEDRLSDLYDAKGQLLNLKGGDEINISGTVGVRSKQGGLEYTDDTTLEDLLTEMQNTYNLPPTDGTIYERPSISIKQAGDGFDETIPLGSIVLRGMPGTAFELLGLNVRAHDNNISDPPPPTAFSSNMMFAEVQAARKAEVRRVEGKVYDDSGAEHTMVTTFIPLQQPGEWMWEITLTGEERIIGGNTGKIIFGVDNLPASFIFDDNSNSFRFDPMNGSSQVDIKIDSGAPGSKEGITQYDSVTTTEFKAQDGYPMGKLEELFIDDKGEISGKYTNGITKAIGMIYLAEFNNPAGLLKHGNSMFAVSPNSGQAVMHRPVFGTPSAIKPGALEMSNVELETEFTNMITIQRGYQANARVITTSDSMLQELVQLVR